MNPQAPIWLFLGSMGLHLFNRFITAFVCEKDPSKKEYVIEVVPMTGIGFHCRLQIFRKWTNLMKIISFHRLCCSQL